MTYIAKKTTSGNYEVFKNGQRVSTTSASGLSRFGLSSSKLSSGTTTQQQAPKQQAPKPQAPKPQAPKPQALTQQQQTEYFKSQNTAKTPTSPLDWLKQQQQPATDIYDFNKAIANKDVSGLKKMGVDTTMLETKQIQSVVDAPPSITTNKLTLKEPDVANVQDSFIASVQSNLETNRTAVENTYKKQIEDLNKQIEDSKKSIKELNTLQAEGIEDVGDTLQPFREQLENAERERLFINKNFQENQLLIDELGTLLSEGNELIRQQKEITGLGAIRNPRIDQTISDVNGRAGVIQAVLNARNGQINQAYNMIDRSIDAINADKKDRLAYYDTLLNFYEGQKDTEGNKLVILDKTKRSFLNAQVSLLEGDLARNQQNADYIKELMTDPNTASFMAKAGVSLNDSPETVNAKMALQTQIQQGKIQQAETRSQIQNILQDAINAGASTAIQQAIVDANSVEEAMSVAGGVIGKDNSFSKTQKMKLEQAGLNNSSRKKQLDFLFNKDKTLNTDYTDNTGIPDVGNMSSKDLKTEIKHIFDDTFANKIIFDFNDEQLREFMRDFKNVQNEMQQSIMPEIFLKEWKEELGLGDKKTTSKREI